MVVTGFEILGAVTGTTSFLVSSMENIATRTRDFRECEQRIRRFNSKLWLQKRQLAFWAQKWSYHDSRAEWDRYRWLWGDEGWNGIWTYLQGIKSTLKKVDQYLNKPTRLERDQRDRFRALKRDHADRFGTAELHETDKNLLEAMCFAIYHNNDLSQRLEYLDRDVKDLLTASKSEYLHQRGRDQEGNVSAEDINVAWALQHRFERLWANLTTAHAQLLVHHFAWSLLLPPSNGEGLELQSCDQLDFAFFRSNLPESNAGHLVRASYLFAVDHDDDQSLYTTIMERLEENTEQQRDLVLKQSFKSLFQYLTVLDRDSQDMSRANNRWERAKAAACLASWIVLVWQSEWAKRLCMCRIRYTHWPVDAPSGPSTSRGLTEPVPVMSIQHIHEREQCFDDVVDQRPHLLLGLALAELALAKPVSIQITRRAVRFKVEGMETPLEPKKLLRQVWNATQSSQYHDAVNYCFKWDEDPERQTRFRAEDIRGYMDHVIRPLELYFTQVVDPHSANNRAFYEFLSAEVRRRAEDHEMASE